MGRPPCCSKVGLNRGPWTAREDTLLIQYIQSHGEGHWRSLPKNAGLLRCGKSCRLRWMNYLRPDIKRGNITPDEDDLIVRLHSLLGNRWSLIAGRLPGRTDNEIKNYWNTHISKRLKTSNQDSTTHNRGAPSKCVGEPKKYEQEEVTTKTMVHLPKPIRVSPLSITKNNMIFGSHKQEAGGHDSEVSNLHDVSWSDEIKGGDGNDFGEILVCDNIKDCDDFVNQEYEGCGLYQNAKPAAAERDSTLPWKMYEECDQQLLKAEDHVQLDSFVDSLLVSINVTN